MVNHECNCKPNQEIPHITRSEGTLTYSMAFTENLVVRKHFDSLFSFSKIMSAPKTCTGSYAAIEKYRVCVFGKVFKFGEYQPLQTK